MFSSAIDRPPRRLPCSVAFMSNGRKGTTPQPKRTASLQPARKTARQTPRKTGLRRSRRAPRSQALALAMHNRANLLRDHGKLAQAETLYRKALALRKRSLGLDHPDVAQIMNCLANLLEESGRHAEAEPLYRQSLA